MKTIHTTAVLSTLVLAVGCKKTPAEETTAPTQVARPSVTAEPKDTEEEDASVNVDPAVAELCDMPKTHFAFNSSKVDKKAERVFADLVACFTTGPAKKHDMRLVGHADPRGEDDYNLALGQRRADSVAKALGKKGLPKQRMETSSRGEMDAAGHDEGTWARDRRVDIELARR